MSSVVSLYAAKAAGSLTGTAHMAGDKSISHRALILAACATGTSRIEGLLEGDDVLATARAMQKLGARIERVGPGAYQIIGVGCGGLKSPDQELDFGNAGTGVRLTIGLVAGAALDAQFIGDASLSSRPMARIMRPLERMGAQFKANSGDTLPLRVHGVPLMPADITPDVASAQVKSALLLAGLHIAGDTIIRETRLTREHSENMLALFGAEIDRYEEDGKHVARLRGPANLRATTINVPGDPSSAAFPIIAALIVPGSDIVLENIMLNRQRDGLIRVMQQMGGDITISRQRQASGETVGDLRIRHSSLRAITVPADLAPDMIDEFPALAIAASCAKGTTHMAGLGELRVKESDRLAAMAAGLEANGVTAHEGEDTLSVTGGAVKGGGLVATHHDHRIAMAFLCLGLVADKPVGIDDTTMIATSFPNFFTLMNTLGAGFEQS